MKLRNTLVYITLVTTTAIFAESPVEINPPVLPDTTLTVCVGEETAPLPEVQVVDGTEEIVEQIPEVHVVDGTEEIVEQISKFERKQAKILAKIEKKQAKLEAYNDCVLVSDTITELKSCKKK